MIAPSSSWAQALGRVLREGVGDRDAAVLQRLLQDRPEDAWAHVAPDGLPGQEGQERFALPCWAPLAQNLHASSAWFQRAVALLADHGAPLEGEVEGDQGTRLPLCQALLRRGAQPLFLATLLPLQATGNAHPEAMTVGLLEELMVQDLPWSTGQEVAFIDALVAHAPGLLSGTWAARVWRAGLAAGGDANGHAVLRALARAGLDGHVELEGIPAWVLGTEARLFGWWALKMGLQERQRTLDWDPNAPAPNGPAWGDWLLRHAPADPLAARYPVSSLQELGFDWGRLDAPRPIDWLKAHEAVAIGALGDDVYAALVAEAHQRGLEATLPACRAPDERPRL